MAKWDEKIPNRGSWSVTRSNREYSVVAALEIYRICGSRETKKRDINNIKDLSRQELSIDCDVRAAAIHDEK